MYKKYVLITGISSGIGLDACRHLIDKGYHIIGTVRKETDKKHLMSRFPEHLDCLVYDVRDYTAIEESLEKVKSILNGCKLLALINNAGIAVPGPLSLVSDEEFEAQIAVNLLAVRKITNSYLPLMYKNDPEQKSKIIFISSISGLLAAPFNGPYCISKHALECMVDIYRRELKTYEIEVIAIQPGPIKTEIWNKNKGSFDKYLDSDYRDIASKVNQVIEHTEKAALPVEKISEVIENILTRDKPKLRYLVHRNAVLFKLIAHFMPTRMMDKLIWKNLNKKDLKNYRPL
jgi:short-subunit dehydrogenase